MNYLKMTGYIVRTASDNWTLGYEGENNARTLRVKTTDSLTNFATVNLLIDTLDCGAMTIQTVSNYRILEMVMTEEMLGLPGLKTCQLVMKNTAGSVVLKTNQFYMYVKSSNVTDRIYISTEDTIKAALTALINDGVLEDLSIEDGSITTAKIANGAITQAKLDPNISFEADDELDATSTNAIQNKVVAQAIGEVNESLANVGLDVRTKRALAKCFSKVAYIDTNGMSYYKELLMALDKNESASAHVVIQNLEGVESDFSDLTVSGAFTAHLTVKPGYDVTSVTVVMGGTDVTSTAYNSNTRTISIASVTGDIEITTTADKDYISNGLVYRWVAEDADGSTWVDRVSDNSITLSGATKSGKYLTFNNSAFGYAEPGTFTAQTLEVVYSTAKDKQYKIVGTPLVARANGRYAWLPAVLPSAPSVGMKDYPNPSLNTVVSDSATFTGELSTDAYNAYRNGAALTANGTSGFSYTSNLSGKIEVGANLTAELGVKDYAMNGNIYEIRVYNRALTANEIAHNFSIDAENYPIV